MEISSALLTPRKKTRQIQLGSVAVGGDAPVSVQSMTTTKTANVDGTLEQIYALSAAGADIVRCTCNEQEAAEGLAQIVPRSPVPIVADIHFHVEMALAALEAYTDYASTPATCANPKRSNWWRVKRKTVVFPFVLV